MDEDGDLDLLVGDREGVLWHFENTGSRTAPVLTSLGKIQANGADLDVGGNACAVVVDWNNDGKKDLIIGIDNYEVRAYLNTGTNAQPTFSTHSVVIRNTGTLMRCTPRVYDLNGDGRKDLIVGEEFGYVYFYPNIGTDASPSFSNQGEKIKLENGDDLKVVSRAHIELVDWDHNGTMDLIVGDNDGTINLFLNTQTGINDDLASDQKPQRFTLLPNYPNPFNAETTIRYDMPKDGFVRIAIYDIHGRKVAELVDDVKSAGSYRITWDAGDYPSGTYLIRLQAGSFVEMRKCILLK